VWQGAHAGSHCVKIERIHEIVAGTCFNPVTRSIAASRAAALITDLAATTVQFIEHLETLLLWQSRIEQHRMVNPVLQIGEIGRACHSDRKWV